MDCEALAKQSGRTMRIIHKLNFFYGRMRHPNLANKKTPRLTPQGSHKPKTNLTPPA